MQGILVYIVFGIAVVFMAWRGIKTLRHKHTDAGCPNCNPQEKAGKIFSGK